MKRKRNERQRQKIILNANIHLKQKIEQNATSQSLS